MSAKDILLNWLADNDLEKVFQALFFLAENYRDEQLRHGATLQSGRQKALETQRISGTLSNDEEALQSARIRAALLQIIKGLNDDWTLDGIENPPVPFPPTSKMNWKKYAAYFAAVIAVLAGVAELSGYNFRDIFRKNEKMENPAVKQPSTPNVSTTGHNSPAVITRDGDVHINYEEPKSTKDTATTKQNPSR